MTGEGITDEPHDQALRGEAEIGHDIAIRTLGACAEVLVVPSRSSAPAALTAVTATLRVFDVYRDRRRHGSHRSTWSRVRMLASRSVTTRAAEAVSSRSQRCRPTWCA